MAGFMTKIREKQNRKLAQCLMASAMSANMLLTSLGGTAYAAGAWSDIAKADAGKSKDTILEDKGLYSVLADSVNGKNALNHFSSFNLAQGNIANLYFGTSREAAAATNLINFVDQRITINGTVNAIQSNKIGGNLYFVSVDGMVVGASGVINAGAINVLTPTQSGYKTLQGDASGWSDVSALADGSYAVNPQGTITVNGKLNAVDGIRLQSSEIDLTGTAALQTKSSLDFSSLVNTTDSQGVAVKAGLEGNLTATAAGNGDIVLSAVADSAATGTKDGVTENFDNWAPRERTATVLADKDSTISADGSNAAVKITATATNEDEGWQIDNMPSDFASALGGVSNPLGQVVYTKATITLNGTIDAAKISAAAVASNEYNSNNDSNKLSEISGDLSHLANASTFLTKVKDVSSILKVDPIYSYMGSEATVSVGKDAKLTASAASTGAWKTDKDAPVLSLTADSKTTNIVQAATSSADSSLAVPSTTKTPATGGRAAGKGQKTEKLAGAAVAYSGTDNTASVVVDGTLKTGNTDNPAGGAIKLQAQATDAMNVKAASNGTRPAAGSSSTLMDAAVAIATGTNKASVTVSDTATVASGGSGVLATAIAGNSIDVNAAVQANTNAIGATGVAVLDYTSDATVNLNGKMTGAMAVAGTATNKTKRNNVAANNSASSLAPTPAATAAADKNALIETQSLQDYISGAKGIKALFKTASYGDTQLKKAGSLLTVGTSIAVASETNTANINVGNTAFLKGSGVQLSATTDLVDTHMAALGSLVNKDAKQSVLVDGAVLVADIDNAAKVTVADSEKAEDGTVKQAKLLGGQVTVNANSLQEYNRGAGLLDDLEKIYADFGALVSDGGKLADSADAKESFAALGSMINDLRGGIKKSTGLNVDDYVGNATNLPNSVSSTLLAIVSLLSGMEQFHASYTQGFQTELKTAENSLAGQVLMFLTPENYANFVAASSVNSSTDGSLAIAGALNANLLNNTANVSIGKDAILNAAAHSVSLATDVAQTNVVMNGRPNVSINQQGVIDLITDYVKNPRKKVDDATLTKVKNLVTFNQTDAAKNSAGGIVGVAQHSTDGSITVGSGAKLTGSDWTEMVDTNNTPNNAADDTATPRYGVELTADNQNITTDLSYSAGKAGNLGFEGLFSWLGGDSTNTITVADDAALTAVLMTNGTPVSYGKINVAANMDTVLTNLVGAVAWGGGSSMGASGAVTDENVTNTISLGGTLNAHSLEVNALTDGIINTITVAGSLATENSNANTTKAGSQLTAQSDSAKVKAAETKGNTASAAAQKSAAAEVKDSNKTTENKAQIGTNPAGTADKDKVTANSTGIAAAEANNQAGPSLNLAAAGSASVNVVTQTTRADLNNAKVTLHENTGATGEAAEQPVNVKAEDGSFVGAWSGAAAVAWQQSEASKATKTVTKTVVGTDGKETTQNVTKAANKVTTAAKVSKLDTKTDINTAEGDKSKQSSATPAKQKKADDVTDKTAAARSASKAALAGAMAVNDITKDVHATFTDVTIANATAVKNIAQSDGAAVAAGLALGLTKASQDSSVSFSGAGAASVNASNNTVEALLKGVEMTKSEGSNVYNLAYDSDTQVAGGVNAALAIGGKMGIGAGGTLAVNDIQNNLYATISGGSLTAGNGSSAGLGSVVNHAANEITQVTTALGVSAAGGAKSGVSFDGVMAYGEITNNAKADITDGAVIAAGTVDNAAYDASDLNKSFDQAIADNGVDSTGATYTDNANHNAATQQKTQGSDETDEAWAKDPANSANMAAGTTTAYSIDADKKGSSKIITTALSLAADVTSNGVGGAGAAAVSVLHGDSEALVEKGSQLTAGRLNNTASTDGLLVNVAGGASAGTGFLSGAGSVSIQTTNKTTKAAIDDSTMTAGDITVDATSNDLDVNLAGQISAGKNAAGLALAVNHLKNTTGAYIYGSTLDAKVESAGNNITVNAANKGQVYSIGAGVSGGSTSAVNGSMALNQGTDDVEAIVDEKTYTDTKKTSKRTTMSNVNTLKVTASDSNMKVAVAGGVQAAGTAAVGGAIAYNEIGSWKVDKDNTSYNDRKQQLNAELSHADITTAGTNAKIDVTGTDTSTLGTAAAGIGGAGTAAVEGAAATSLIGRQTHAAMTDTNIDQTAGTGTAQVTAKAENTGKLYNNALVIAGSGTASVGVGAAVDYDSTDADTLVSGGAWNIGNLDALAVSNDTIVNFGIGGAAAGVAGVAGSVGVNVLGGNTSAVIENGANITAANNIIVSAQSSRSIDNIAGVLAGAGEGMAAGLAVTVNDVHGDTKATVQGAQTKLTAKGNGAGETVTDGLASGQLRTDKALSSSGIKFGQGLTRKENSYNGIAVSASNISKIQDFVVNVGITGMGATVNGNVNVNTISGTTAASAEGAAFNAGTKGDIHVVANDYADTAGFIGGMSSTGVGGSFGLGSNTLTINRTVAASLKGAAANTAASARNVAVTADAGYGVGALNLGIAFVGVGGSVQNVDNITLLNGKTTADIENLKLDLSGDLLEKANRVTNIYTIGIAASASGGGGNGGVGVDVVKDDSTTTADMKKNTVTLTVDNVSKVQIGAANQTHDKYELYALNANLVGGSGSSNVSVGNMAATVKTTAADTTIGTADKRAKSVDITAENSMDVKQMTWAGQASISGMAVGANIAVVTVDSDVDTIVQNSSLYSRGAINVAAQDTRSADLSLGNTSYGTLAGNLNVGIMTVGHKVEDQYVYTDTDGNTTDSGADLKKAYTAANDAIKDNTLTTEKSLGTNQQGPALSETSAERGGDKTTSIDTAVTGSTLDAGTTGDVSVTSTAKTTATVRNVDANVSVVALTGDVEVLDAARNASVTVSGSTITGQALTLGSYLTGDSTLKMYQGAASVIGLEGAYGFSRVAGDNHLTLDGSTLTANGEATGKVTVLAEDNSSVNLEAFAVQTSLAAGALQIAAVDDIGAVTVKIGSQKENTITAKAADGISIKASNAPKLTTSVNDVSAAIGALVGVTAVSAQVGSKDQSMQTILQVGDGNAFIAPEVELLANASPTTKSDLEVVSAALNSSVQVNHSQADDYSEVVLNVGKNQYGSNVKDHIQAADLIIKAENNTDQTVEAGAVTASGGLYFAQNKASVHDKLTTTTTATGVLDKSLLHNANVTAATSAATMESSQSYGAAVLFGSSAAETKHELTTNTLTTLSGQWDLTGNLVAVSGNKETLTLGADTIGASVVNGSGAGIDSTVKQSSNLTLSSATVTTAGSQTYDAGTHVNDRTKIQSSGYGSVGSDESSNLTQKDTYTGKVNMNDGQSVLTAGENIKVSAATIGLMDSDNEMKVGVSALQLTLAFSHYDVTSDNDITLKNATLTTLSQKEAAKNGDISLAAYDDMALNYNILADTEFDLAAISQAHTEDTLHRTNDVTLQSGTLIHSAGDANLYTARSAGGGLAGTALTINSAAYNKSLLPFKPEADITTKLEQANVVTTEAGSTVESGEDINIAANKGADSISQDAHIYALISDESVKPTTVSDGAINSSGNKVGNNATINGKVIAGIHNNAVVEISGTVGDKKDSADYSQIKVDIKEGSDWLKASDFKGATQTITNPYYTQYNNLLYLLTVYPKGSAEYNTYSAQCKAMEQVMSEEGFATLATEKDGTVIKDQYIVHKSVDYAAISLPSIAVSGGNVNVHADQLNVGGSLTANGAPTISITNSSPLVLKVADADIENAGGSVYLNGSRVDAAADITGLSGMENIHTSAAADASITIASTGSADTKLGQKPDIFVYGDIVNKAGKVTISNTNGNITIDGDAVVSGKAVYITADKGNLTQNTPDGILYAGSDPTSSWVGDKDNAANIQTALHWYLEQKKTKTLPSTAFANYSEYRSWVLKILQDYNDAHKTAKLAIDLPETQKSQDASAGQIAGGSVFLSGREVNLNGLVQSGYDSYTVELSDDANTKIKALDDAYKGGKIDDAEVKNNSSYCISAGGNYYDAAAGHSKYHVAVYYNPDTKNIIVDDVTAAGGQINITGNIGNTNAGMGRVYAANGAAAINVDTSKAAKDVVLGTITNSDRAGSIRITDNLQNKVYEYTYKDGKNVGIVHTRGKNGGAVTLTDEEAQSFKPQTGLVYSWTGGVTSQKTQTCSYQTDKWLFEWVDGKTTPEEIKKQHESDIVTTKVTDGTPQGLEKGDYFSTPASGTASDGFGISGTLTQTDYESTPIEVQKDKKGLFGWIKTVYTYSWNEQVGEASSTTYSLKADNPVSIGFLNAAKSGITVKTSGNLKVAGGIEAANGSDNVNLTSLKGSVNGDGLITTNNLTAAAATGISSQQAVMTAGDTANVDLKTASGTIALHSEGGKLNVKEAVVTDSGSTSAVTLQASGDILNGAASGAAVQASRISLISDNGTIGTKEKAMLVKAGEAAVTSDPSDASLSATAQGDIYLTQTSGDMRVNSIVSRNGDVTLQADSGNIVNAAPISATAGNLKTRMQSWLDAGLISAKDAADSNTNAGTAIKESQTSIVDKRIQELATETCKSKAEADAAANNTSVQPVTSKQVSDQAKVYTDEAAAYAADSTVQAARTAYISALQSGADKDTVAKEKTAYTAAQTAYFQDKDYSTAEQQAIENYAEVTTREEASYGWSKNQLLYAVQDSVLNSKAGTVALSDTANVSGKNITLIAANGGIGADMDAKTYDKTELKTVAARQALAQARAGDLTVNRDANGKFTGITMEQHQPLTIKLADADAGNLTIKDTTHTYIATTKKDKLNLTQSIGNAGQDVMLLAGTGITQNAGVIITGSNLTLASGTGSIGTEQQNVQTVISGNLSANSGESMYISQTGADPLTVKTATAGQNINLKALKGIVMTGVEAGKAVGYLTAGNAINLLAESGNIGAAKNGIRILNNSAVVNAAAQNGAADVYLTGEKTGDLVLGTITARELGVTDDTGTVKLARAANTTQTASPANINVANATIAAQDIDLTDGRMTATNAAGLTFKAANTITQANTENSVLGSAGTVTFQTGTAADDKGTKAAAGGTIDVESQYNTFAKVNLRAADETAGINGYTKVVSNAANGLTANFGAGKEGTGTLTVAGGGSKKLDVQVWNVADGINKASLTLSGKLTTKDTGMLFTSGDKLTVAADTVLNSGKRLWLIGKNGVTTDSGAEITADTANLTAKSGNITLAGPLQMQTSLTATAGQGITLGTVDAGAVNLTAAGSIELNGGTTKVQSLTANAGGDITTTEQGNVTSNGMMSLTAGSNISLHDITVKAGDTTLTAKQGSIGLNGTTNVQNLTANAGQDISTGTSDVTFTSNGIANLIAGRDVKLDAVTKASSLSVKAGNDITSTKGILANTDSLTAENDIKLSGNTTRADNLTAGAGNNITLENVQVRNNLISAAKGDISLSKDVFANNNIVLDAGKSLTAGTMTTMMATNFIARAGADLTVTGTGDTVSARGNLSLTAGNKLLIPTEAAAGNNLTLEAGTGGIKLGSATAGNHMTLLADTGNIDVTKAATTNGYAWVEAKGTGDVTVGTLSAGSKADVYHDGAGNINLGTVTANDLDVAHSGTGDITIQDATSRNNSSIQHNGTGDINVTTASTGDRSWFVTRNGDMNFGNVQSGDRVMLLNYGHNDWTHINRLSAGNLVVMLAFHQDIDKIEVRTTLDLLLAGDQTRKAVGWEGAHEAYRGMQPYLFRQNLPDFGERIGVQPVTTILPANAPQDQIEITE